MALSYDVRLLLTTLQCHLSSYQQKAAPVSILLHQLALDNLTHRYDHLTNAITHHICFMLNVFSLQ